MPITATPAGAGTIQMRVVCVVLPLWQASRRLVARPHIREPRLAPHHPLRSGG